MYHVPIMVDEVLAGLNINPHGIYVDGTMGGGGHSYEIASRLTDGKLIAIDQDEDAINEAKKRLVALGNRVQIVQGNFINIDYFVHEAGFEGVDGILLDIGVSSHQLDDGDRGFSYHQDARLDMRMDQGAELSAWNVVNEYTEEKLEEIILKYGEERWAKRIAAFIVEARKYQPINSTSELTEVIKKAIPKNVRLNMKHPSRKVFQALRIEVNNELEVLEATLDKSINLLNKDGRIAVITFHSLEDRIVKEKFRYWQKDCICPTSSPICQCDKVREGKIITRKPITASDEELERNIRSKSAKLRIFEKS